MVSVIEFGPFCAVKCCPYLLMVAPVKAAVLSSCTLSSCFSHGTIPVSWETWEGLQAFMTRPRGTKPHASQTPNSAPSGAVSTVPRSFLTGQARTICEPLLCTSLQASCDRGLLLRPFEGLLCDPVKMGSALRLSFLSHPVSFPCSCSSITQHLWPGMGYQKCRNPLIDSVLPPDLL